MLRALTDHGHTVLVIEHNTDFIWASDYVIDLGPGSGDEGGEIVAQGTPEEIIAAGEKSLTGQALLPYMRRGAENGMKHDGIERIFHIFKQLQHRVVDAREILFFPKMASALWMYSPSTSSSEQF